jgi:hypothetical protein
MLLSFIFIYLFIIYFFESFRDVYRMHSLAFSPESRGWVGTIPFLSWVSG